MGPVSAGPFKKRKVMATYLEDEAFLGTEKKYHLEIVSEGFDMETDDFEVELKRGPNVITLKKNDLVKDVNGDFYVTFDTAELGPGGVTMTVTAYVPDEDFPDGLRTEIDKFKFLKIKSH